MEKELYTIFHIVLGLPLGLIGFLGSIVWYHSLNSSPGSGIGGMYIGPVILGMFSLILLIWSGLTVLAAWRAKEESEIEI